MVQQLLAELEWTMKTAVEEGLKKQKDSGLTVDPNAFKKAMEEESPEERAAREAEARKALRAAERQAWLQMETLKGEAEADMLPALAAALTTAAVADGAAIKRWKAWATASERSPAVASAVASHLP